MSVDRYPLQWPVGWPRTPAHRRGEAPYKVTFVVSSNLKLRQDGLPYAGQREPEDSGIAVYWTQSKQQRVIACDHWRTRRDNMRAIGLTIDGLRAIQRSGASSILDRAFAGFAALPSGIVMPTPWRTTLGLGDDCTLEDVKAAFRELARQHHPDRGGDPKTMQRINAAREAAEQELGNG